MLYRKEALIVENNFHLRRHTAGYEPEAKLLE
jgi:hypothetical protein